MTRIVVGVDGSDGASQALAWAVEEAKRRCASIHAVAIWAYPALVAATPLPAPTFEEFRQAAADALEEAIAACVPDDVDVTRRVVQGTPATVLAAEPSVGDLLVVGRRGLGGFERLLLGSVSRGVLRRTHVPTVVVPAVTPGGHGVVVGLDGVDDRMVVDAAIDAAERRATTCTAVHAVDFAYASATLVGAEATDAMLDAGRALVADALAAARSEKVKLEGTTRLGPASSVLVDAAVGAELLVVGRRSHGILGSVADACAAHASCPVLVVPAA